MPITILTVDKIMKKNLTNIAVLFCLIIQAGIGYGQISAAQMPNRGLLNDERRVSFEPDYQANPVKNVHLITVNIVIDEKGNVVKTETVGDDKFLNILCTNKAKQTKFAPYFVSGKAVASKGYLTFRFSPPSANPFDLTFTDQDLSKLTAQNKAAAAERTAATALFEQGENVKAVAALTKYIDGHPGIVPDIEILEMRSQAYRQIGKYAEAFDDLNTSIQWKPTARNLTLRGDFYRKQGLFKTVPLAFADYEQAIKLDSKYSPVYDSRGYLKAVQKSFDEAFADLNKAIALDPKNSSAYAHRGYAYAKKFKTDEAVADFRKAVELNPKNYIAAYNLQMIQSDEDDDIVLSDEEYAGKDRKIYFV